jgi:hypothetical protein
MCISLQMSTIKLIDFAQYVLNIINKITKIVIKSNKKISCNNRHRFIKNQANNQLSINEQCRILTFSQNDNRLVKKGYRLSNRESGM